MITNVACGIHSGTRTFRNVGLKIAAPHRRGCLPCALGLSSNLDVDKVRGATASEHAISHRVSSVLMKTVKSQNGFSLLELLVALLVLGLMFLLMSNSLGIGSKVWDSLDRRATNQAELIQVQNLLRKTFNETRPIFTPARRVLFEGDTGMPFKPCQMRFELE